MFKSLHVDFITNVKQNESRSSLEEKTNTFNMDSSNIESSAVLI